MTVAADARTAELVAFFTEIYGVAPEQAVRAPGRVNLIGEHTDYNDGFCLPMAIERDVRIALRPREDRTVRVASVQEAGRVSFELSTAIAKDASVPWADYVKGCAQVLLEEGVELVGCDLALTGDVPLGSGLSSSAALEVATIHALLTAASVALEDERIAQLAQRAENAYVGTNCGILDQLSSACGMEGRAMLMDCRTLVLEPVPVPDGVSVVIADTGKRRGLVDSAYNERRAQCEAGAAALGVSHLRDVTLHGLRAAADAGKIDADTLRRCQHVVAENGRTEAAAACLRAGDAKAFGCLMDASHDDLRAKFEVTCAELDTMVGIARGLDGCLGSRMTGAGFGGCTVSLVRDEAVEGFVAALEKAYAAQFDLPVAVYVTRAADGAGRLDI
ncbi:MAG: galactokinase [Planctomycetota bacterium]|jgi:galactokinase|nr:galactokinase [Planctomycetota bacterium]